MPEGPECGGASSECVWSTQSTKSTKSGVPEGPLGRTGRPDFVDCIEWAAFVEAAGMRGRARPDNFPRVNDYRNPLLAEAMKILGFVNKFSRGVSKVQDELAANGNPRATFDLNHRTEFRVTVVGQSGPNARKRWSNPDNVAIAESKIIDFVKAHPGVKRDEISLELKIPLRTLGRHLKKLALERGAIEYRGTNRSGGWYVRT